MLPQCLFPRLRARQQTIILRLQPAAAGHRRHRLAPPKGGFTCGWQTATLRNILTSSCAILYCFAPTVLLPANMRKMSTERSRRSLHLQDRQTTLCPETNLLRSRGERSRLDRKLSTTAPEHCYSCLGALLQRLRKVAPKPPEKAYSPLRKNSKLRKTMTAKLLRMSGYLPDKSHQPTEQRKESRREKPAATRQETAI